MVRGVGNGSHEAFESGHCGGGIYFLFVGELESKESLVEEIFKSVNEIINMRVFGNA